MATAAPRVSVNLLPPELAARARARRIMQYTVGGVLVFVGALGLVYLLRLSEVSRAEDTRDAAQLEVVRLESDLAELDEYRALVELMDNRSSLLASAMEKEIAYSEVLNNLSLVFPDNASLLNLTIAAAEPEAPAAGEIDFGESVATGEFSGYSVERFAPGVETVLLDLDRTPSFFNAFVTTAAGERLGETEVTNFNGTVALDRGAYTGRYADGLPPEVTP